MIRVVGLTPVCRAAQPALADTRTYDSTGSLTGTVRTFPNGEQRFYDRAGTLTRPPGSRVVRRGTTTGPGPTPGTTVRPGRKRAIMTKAAVPKAMTVAMVRVCDGMTAPARW